MAITIAEKIGALIEFRANPNAGNTWGQHVLDWTGTTRGAGQIASFSRRILGAGAFICKNSKNPALMVPGVLMSQAEAAIAPFSAALGVFRFPRIVFDDLAGSARTFANRVSLRNALDLSCNLADASATALFGSITLAKDFVPFICKDLAGRMAAFGGYADLCAAIDDVYMTNALLKEDSVQDDEGITAVISASRTRALIELVKTVSGIASAVLATVALIYGITATSSVMLGAALVIAPLAETTLAIVSHFYRETAEFPILKAKDLASVYV